MKRAGTKKSSVERRRKPRSNKSQASRRPASASHGATTRAARSPAARSEIPASQAAAQPQQRIRIEDACYHCAKDLCGNERALFVEEEIGRVFCSESCITSYFAPEIERLEKDYLKRVSAGDLTSEEREGLAHLRWITLQEADEVWREKTLSGDNRYTLISEFQPGNRKVWCVCICLFLRGEPSFLFIAFTTKNASLLNAYRRGERVQWENKKVSAKAKGGKRKEQRQGAVADPDPEQAEGHGDLGDRLADAWTEDETFLAQVNQERSRDDIPPKEFELFQSCLEETLEAPDEVWSVEMSDPEGVHLYHFIREYASERPGYWYVIVARETEDEEQIEILDAFPTRDAHLVERYRRGTQEVGESSDSRPTSRLVH